MRRLAPPNPFSDALGLCNLKIPEAAEYLGRSPHAIQCYASGTRSTPPDVLKRLGVLYAIATQTDLETDTQGVPIPAGALAVRRARRDPLIAAGFDELREIQAHRLQPDPDASPFVAVGEIPDDDVSDRDDDQVHASDGPPVQDEDEDEGETP